MNANALDAIARMLEAFAHYPAGTVTEKENSVQAIGSAKTDHRGKQEWLDAVLSQGCADFRQFQELASDLGSLRQALAELARLPAADRDLTSEQSPPETQRSADREGALATGLTPRQADVFVELAKGRSASEIAAALKIRTNTARVHIRVIYARLNVSNRIEAVNRVRGS